MSLEARGASSDSAGRSRQKGALPWDIDLETRERRKKTTERQALALPCPSDGLVGSLFVPRLTL